MDKKFYDETIKMLEEKQKPEKGKPLAEKLYSKPLEKENETAAKFIPELQTIFMKETDSLSIFYHRCFHELTEFKSYQEMEQTEDGTKVSQIGISSLTKSGEKSFEKLKEAIIEELNKREYETISKNPNFQQSLQKEIAWTQERKKDLLSKVGDKDIREQINDILFIPPFSLIPSETEKPSYEMFSSHEERKILNSLVKKITEKNPNFKNSEQVMELFFQSLFSGKFEWKEPIEKTFGEGTFEKLGKLDQKPQEMEKFINGL